MFADGKVIKIYCFTDNFYKELEKIKKTIY